MPNARGLEPISELQRLTVSLRGGFAQKDRCLVLYFTGKLDAYSEKQFSEYASDVLKANKLPVLFRSQQNRLCRFVWFGCLGSAR